MTLKIQTLDEILAEMGNTNSASIPQKTHKSPKSNTNPITTNPAKTAKASTKQRPNHQTKTTSHSTATLTTIPTNSLHISPNNSAELNHILSTTAPEPLVVNDKKTNRLRWLAFYYLSRRELSAHELRQKLLAKEQDPDDVESLLVEFAQKGYQSDERCAYMLIRESLRKGRGKQHIKQLFKHAKLDDFDLEDLLSKITEDMADGTILENNDDIDWLKLAVEARCKKYGNSIPKDLKEKARQLRFLQYRGFDYGVCFDALKKTLSDFDDFDS